MSVRMVPVIRLKYEQEFSSEALDALDSLTVDDEFTYTMRVTVAPERVDAIRKQLGDVLDPEEFERLTKLLDETEWDCSFLVDCY